MKERDPEKTERIAQAVRDALADLLAHLEENGLNDWVKRYSEIKDPLDDGDYVRVVELVERNQKTSHDDADRMNLLCRYLDTPPPEEMERLARGHAKHGKYYAAFNRSLLLGALADRALRPYINYGFFNEPEKITDDNKRIQAIVAGAPKPDS